MHIAHCSLSFWSHRLAVPGARSLPSLLAALIIIMYLSAVCTLILTALIHCRGSIWEQVMSSTSWIAWANLEVSECWSKRFIYPLSSIFFIFHVYPYCLPIFCVCIMEVNGNQNCLVTNCFHSFLMHMYCCNYFRVLPSSFWRNSIF